MDIRHIIREELQKTQLVERKKGHNTVTKIANLVLGKYKETVHALLKRRGDSVLEDMDVAYQEYLLRRKSPRDELDKENTSKVWNIDIDPFRFFYQFKVIFHRFNGNRTGSSGTLARVPSHVDERIELAPIKLELNLKKVKINKSMQNKM